MGTISDPCPPLLHDNGKGPCFSVLLSCLIGVAYYARRRWCSSMLSDLETCTPHNALLGLLVNFAGCELKLCMRAQR